MDTVYRVEKDGITFTIQPEMCGYYASEGYAVYKTVEIPITEEQAIAVSDAYEPSVEGTIEGEEVQHG